MRFLIKYPLLGLASISESRSHDLEQLEIEPGVQSIHTVKLEDGTLTIVGDPIPSVDLLKGLKHKDVETSEMIKTILQAIGGHYYWILESPCRTLIGTSFASILPIYYAQENGNLIIGSKSKDVAEQIQNLTVNQTNLLERFVFNYAFQCSTWWNEINLLPTHGAIVLENRTYRVVQADILQVEDCRLVKSSQKDLRELIDLFIDRSASYYPSSESGISLTGGFDGRTLVALARHHGNPFYTYSFGNEASSDIQIASQIARAADFEYSPIVLDEKYLENEVIQSAINFLIQSEFNGNLGRPHYQYAARKLATRTKHIITGNFGSELFRALHIPGVMMSKTLIDIFSNKGGWENSIIAQSKEIGIAQRHVADDLISQIKTYLTKNFANPNHRFYHYVMHEIFRKYFGPELVMQYLYLSNRTPFLDLHFVKALNQSKWSGVHSSLFERSKVKRMKGQEFYAALLRRTDHQLYKAKTSKGYSPNDLHTVLGIINIGKGVILRKLRSAENDENSIGQLFTSFRPQIIKTIQKEVGDIRSKKNTIQESEHNIITDMKKLSIEAGWTNANNISRRKIGYLVDT